MIFTRDTHGKDYLSTQEGKNLPVEHCIEGTPGWEIEESLKPLCRGVVISNALLLKANMPEVPITVDSTCCAGVTPQSHANALEAMKMCQIRII